jgi:hypothetical protein
VYLPLVRSGSLSPAGVGTGFAFSGTLPDVSSMWEAAQRLLRRWLLGI